MTIMNKTKYGTGYEAPVGLSEDNYYDLMYELIDFYKIKGLTTRQAQKLFIDCADMILDVKPTEYNDCNNIYLKSIAESLNKIAYKGTDIYKRCSSTNN